MGRRILAVGMLAVMLLLAACGGVLPENPNAAEASAANEGNHEQTLVGEKQIPYRYASREEGESFMLSRGEYFSTLNQNELNYKLQHKNASVEEYQDFAAGQVLEFTEEEMALIDSFFTQMENTLAENGYSLPQVGEIVLIKTTMEEDIRRGRKSISRARCWRELWRATPMRWHVCPRSSGMSCFMS